MEYINCRVDTQPMADELHSVSRHVTGTTTAVVAMQAAVIQADKEAAERVCNDVNRGFHADEFYPLAEDCEPAERSGLVSDASESADEAVAEYQTSDGARLYAYSTALHKDLQLA